MEVVEAHSRRQVVRHSTSTLNRIYILVRHGVSLQRPCLKKRVHCTRDDLPLIVSDGLWNTKLVHILTVQACRQAKAAWHVNPARCSVVCWYSATIAASGVL